MTFSPASRRHRLGAVHVARRGVGPECEYGPSQHIAQRLQHPEGFPYNLAPAAVSIRDLRKLKVAALAKTDLPPVQIEVLLKAWLAGRVGFTLDTYGHLMDRLPVQPVEWIDDLVFPEGWEAALKLPLYGAPSGATPGHALQRSEGLEPKDDAGWRNVVQSGATGCMVGGAGFEPATSSV